MQQMLRHLLFSVGWHIEKVSESTDDCFEAIATQKACVTIIDDSLDLPATVSIRKMFSRPISFCYPIVCFLMDKHAEEFPLLSSFGFIEVIKKPIVPTTFTQAFNRMLKRWETQSYFALRLGGYKFINTKSTPSRIDVMARLSQLPEIKRIPVLVLAHELAASGFPLKAESLLLDFIKQNPSDAPSIIALADLYLRWCMPYMAHRFFSSITKKHQNSLCLYPDLIQAHCMLNQIQEALELLQTAYKKDYYLAEILPFYLRLLFADGRESEANEIGKHQKGLYKKVQSAWEEIESEPPSQDPK